MTPLADPLSLDARRILVIAPHPDDESLGCGGLIAALAEDGRDVRTVFVTDGAGSHPNSASWPRTRLAELRRQEAVAALEGLAPGGRAPVFLDVPDAGMPDLDGVAGKAATDALARVMMAFEPDLVLAPWRRDPHCDHRDAWALTRRSLAEARQSPAILEYAVWLDELGCNDDQPRADEAVAIDFDISSVLERKREAVLAHLSQTTDLINDDPDGFRLSATTLDRLVQPTERYWRAAW